MATPVSDGSGRSGLARARRPAHDHSDAQVRVRSMRDLLRASLKTGSGTLGTLVLGAAVMKGIAMVLGPAGVGLFSILRHAQQTGTVICTCGGQTALIQGLASRSDEDKGHYIGTAFKLFAVVGVALAIVMVVLAPWMAPLLLSRTDPAAVAMVRWLTVPILLGGLVALLSGILNGYRAIGRLAWINVAVAGMMAVLVLPACRAFEVGHSLALVWLLGVGFVCGIILAVALIVRGGWMVSRVHMLRGTLGGEAMRHYMLVGGTTLVTGLAQTGTVLVIRAVIVHRLGIESAGVFDVAWTLSMMYVMLALTSFGTYYLPTLSKIVEPDERKTLVLSTLRLSLLLMVPLVTTVIVLRPVVITVLYSSAFVKSVSIMRWMLIGDYLKVSSWVLAMPMVAYADMKRFFWSEMIGNGAFLLFSALALQVRGDMQWVGIGFLLLYVCYFSYTIYYIGRHFSIGIPGELAAHMAWGLGLIVAASAFWWRVEHVRAGWAIGWIIVAVLFSWVAFLRERRAGVAPRLEGAVRPPGDDEYDVRGREAAAIQSLPQ